MSSEAKKVLRPFKPFDRLCFKEGIIGGTITPIVVLKAFVPNPISAELVGVLIGTGTATDARASTIRPASFPTVYPLQDASALAWQGSKIELDRAALFGSFMTTETSPSPLANIRMEYSDGSTWGVDYEDFLVNAYASASNAAQSGVLSGKRIRVYAGNKATLTLFTCNSLKLIGSIPDLSDCLELEELECFANLLTGPIPNLDNNVALIELRCFQNSLTGSIPNLSNNIALELVNCNTNMLTGYIPDLSSNLALSTFYCYNNKIVGTIPDLSANVALTAFRCDTNQIVGDIPDLSANTALTIFQCNLNQITGFAGGWPAAAITFNVANNALSVRAVNRILVDALAYGIPVGTTIDLSGGTNAVPTDDGAIAKAALILAGATVTTN